MEEIFCIETPGIQEKFPIVFVLMEMFEKSRDEFCVPLTRRIRQAEVLEEESEGCEVLLA